jgi:hypothetical protein
MQWPHSPISNSAPVLTAIFKLNVVNVCKKQNILHGNES